MPAVLSAEAERMRLIDQPEWVQRVYWYFNGPVGHPQPHAKGYVDMSAGGVISFLIIEFVLFCVLMLALWAVKKVVKDGEAAKWVSYLLIAIIAGAMLLKLLAFAGIW